MNPFLVTLRCKSARGNHCLTKREPTVVWGDVPMPDRAEANRLQAGDGELEQEGVLETTTRERYGSAIRGSCDLCNQVGERQVKTARDAGGIGVALVWI